MEHYLKLIGIAKNALHYDVLKIRGRIADSRVTLWTDGDKCDGLLTNPSGHVRTSAGEAVWHRPTQREMLNLNG